MLDTMPTQVTPEQESRAANDYETLIEQQPEEALAYAGKGNMLLFLKRPAAALVAYVQGLTLAPKLSPAWVGKACALKALQQATAQDDGLHY